MTISSVDQAVSFVDRATLRQLVGPRTFARGQKYARSGAVRSLAWDEAGSLLVGEIQGTGEEPYQTLVELERSSSAKRPVLRSRCTCPVGVDCKHAVALLLASEGAPSAVPRPPRHLALVGDQEPPGPARAKVSRRQALDGWELRLKPLLAGAGAQAEEREVGELGLQFELVRPPERSGTPAGTRIRLRPVNRTQAGSWSRSGISWSNLDYFGYGRGDERAEQLSLLKEVLALSRLSDRTSPYSYQSDVWLEKINSRRIWDLLLEARELGVPLLSSGRRARTVGLTSSRAEAAIDVTHTAEGLRLQPRIEVGGLGVAWESSILLGNPAHGIAWSDEPPEGATDTPLLHLAALAGPIDDTLLSWLGQEPISVPAPEEERFLAEVCPRLSRRVAVRSSDQSVALPEPAPATLVLTVTHEGGHRISLSWARGRAGTDWRDPLWASWRRAYGPGGQDAPLEVVTPLVASWPGLVEETPWGERIAPSAVLEGMEAVRFVAELLPVLAELEVVEVELEDAVPDYREALEAPVLSLTGSGSRDGDWFDLTVEVTVGGEEVPFHQLFVALAEGQSHLILPSGTYFSLERDELRELAQLIAEARSLGDTPSGEIRLSRFQVSLWEDLCRLGVVTAQAGAWEASVRALADSTDLTDQPTPESLCAELRPYQTVGFNWLAFLQEHRLGGVLADDMGLGKTLQALALMCHTKERGTITSPYLVVAPTSVVANWAAECRRFAPDLDVVTVSETERRRGVPLAEMAAQVDVVITSYALFRLEYEDYEALDWAGLFLDEAQFAKNRHSKTYHQVKTLPVPFKVAMTGTPMENNLMELWSLLSIAAPGLFPSPDGFEEHYRVPIERHADAERMAQLHRRIRPLMLRRTKGQVVADLPDKQEQVLELDLNPKHRKLYQTYLARERQKVLGLLGDFAKNRFEIFRSLTLLRQASLDLSLVDPKHAKVPSTKLDVMMEMLQDAVADGHRVLVFSQFTRFLAEARRRIEAAGIDHCYLDGRTRKREAVISDFRDGKAAVFLISLKAGGFGLNLTEADHCILLDPWWNPATEAQAVDRVHRIGQTRKVMVYRLVARDTIEEKVMALKAKKEALFANVVDGGGFESGALTAADIRGLLS